MGYGLLRLRALLFDLSELLCLGEILLLCLGSEAYSLALFRLLLSLAFLRLATTAALRALLGYSSLVMSLM